MTVDPSASGSGALLYNKTAPLPPTWSGHYGVRKFPPEMVDEASSFLDGTLYMT